MRINAFTLIWITTLPWICITWITTVDTPFYDVIIGLVGNILSLIPFI